MRIPRLNISLVALACMSACAAEPGYMRLPVVHDPRPKFILMSWRTSARDAFALFSSDREMYQFLDGFRPTAPNLTFAQLRQRIERLPRRCLVEWMADPANNIEWPKATLKKRVKILTDSREIDLQQNLIVTEPGNV